MITDRQHLEVQVVKINNQQSIGLELLNIEPPPGAIIYQIDKEEAESKLSDYLSDNWEFDDVSLFSASVVLYNDREFYVSFHVDDEEYDERERDHTDVGMFQEIVWCFEEIYELPVIDFWINDEKEVVYLIVKQAVSKN
ncbi:hypothetical protein [Paenibacillus ihuae]|uniref:hypothetical protein n=1 Tax=Paenibacillus ihuae TaxID=1232431 RepID=UPI0006D54D30|nr:hypothetical protein [Paenibacillus ihuae]